MKNRVSGILTCLLIFGVLGFPKLYAIEQVDHEELGVLVQKDTISKLTKKIVLETHQLISENILNLPLINTHDIKFVRDSALVEVRKVTRGTIVVEKHYDYSLTIKHPDTNIQKRLTAVLEQIQSYKPTRISSENFLKIFMDTGSGIFLVNPKNELLGLAATSTSYLSELDTVLQKAKERPGIAKFLKYKYFVPFGTKEMVSESYAWVIYIEELDWLLGVGIPSDYFSIITETYRQETEKASNKRNDQLKTINKILFRVVFALVFTVLGLFFFYLKLRKNKKRLRNKKNILESTEAELKKSNSELLENNKQLELYLQAAENASSFIALVDDKNIIRWTNDAFEETLSRTSESKAVGVDFLKVTNCRDKKWLKEEIGRRKNGDKKIPISYNSSLGDRKTYSVLNFFSGSHLNKDWMVLVDTDIQEVEDQKEIRENIFRSISHDIISPLMSSLSKLSRIEKKVNSDIKGDIIKVINSVSASFNIVDNFRETTRFELGKINDSAEELNLFDQVDDSIQALNIYLDCNKIEVSNTIDPSISIFMVKEMIQSIIRNLVANAAESIRKKNEATSTGIEYSGKIELTAEKRADSNLVTFCIVDNGTGLSSKNAEGLFKNASISSGLGTYLVKYFLKHHGENLDIDLNSTPHLGTTICLELPTTKR